MASSFSIALTALQAESQAIDVTGNNLANMNTNGFKESEVDFKDLVSEYYSSTRQVGLGVNTLTSNQIFSQGSIESSSSSLAAAIEGDGLFVVNSNDGQQLYTRDGNFVLDSSGVLRTETGEAVQGWTATSTGLDTNGAVGNITIPSGQLLPPQATQNFSITANLDSSATAGTSSGTFSTPVPVVDSLGNTHDLTLTFTRSTTNPQVWNYNVTIPSGDLSGGTAGNQTSLTTGSVTFNSDGTMSTANGTAPVVININGLADGAANMAINWNQFTNGTGNITEYDNASSTASKTIDGQTGSEVNSIAIDTGGQVVASYSNGKTSVLAQLALANIENPNTLQNVGNNNFAATGDTAVPAIGTPQSGGRGQILGGSLEASNVDMATEFTHLIIYQSGYQAASRVISTENTVEQDLFSLIH